MVMATAVVPVTCVVVVIGVVTARRAAKSKRRSELGNPFCGTAVEGAELCWRWGFEGPFERDRFDGRQPAFPQRGWLVPTN